MESHRLQNLPLNLKHVARERRPKPGTDGIASPDTMPVMRLQRDRSEVQSLPNAKLLGRKIGGSWGPESERGAAYREKKRMMENHGLCGYFQAVVRSEQHFLSVRTGLAVEAVWVCLHLPLGGLAASVLSALLLPAVFLQCHQMEKEVTFLSPFTVVFWKGCFCCWLLFFYNQEAVTATVDL